MAGQWEQLGIIIAILSMFVAIGYPFLLSPDQIRPEAVAFMGLVLIAFFTYLLYAYFNGIQKAVGKHDEAILSLRDKVDYMDAVHALDKRVSFLERRKGMIDPRIIILAIMLVLLVLYLRSLGVLRF